MTLRLIAPAKLNLTLEVLGVRVDAYHEIASVMQTIDLADVVTLAESDALTLTVSGEVRGVPVEQEANLAYRAALALRKAVGLESLGAAIGLEKRIPASGGLGGGSSDAAAVLRGLDRLWELGLGAEGLKEIAAGVGADVAFFIDGGTALATGLGEEVEAMPELQATDLTLFVSESGLAEKTRQMYAALTPADFSDVTRTLALMEKIGRGEALGIEDCFNAFEGALVRQAPEAAEAMAACRAADLPVVLCGSGPCFFSLASRAALPAGLEDEMAPRWGVTTVECRTLSRTEALRVEEA